MIWSLIVSLFAVGGLFGAVSVKLISGRLGRKKAVILNNFIAIVAGGIMLTSKMANSYEMVIVARILHGYSAGLGLSIHVMYLGEISPRKIRGIVTFTAGTFLSLGKLSGQFFGLRYILIVRMYEKTTVEAFFFNMHIPRYAFSIPHSFMNLLTSNHLSCVCDILSKSCESWGVISTLNTELFIQSNRVAALVLTGIQRWLMFVVVGLVFPFLITALGSYSFVLFGCMCLLGFLYTFFVLPETKGKTILEISEEFKAITVCGKSFAENKIVETKL
ncbi:putative solute carrier family 2 facilitated glucose transporter member 9-like isoform 2 [Scophthalmus maximus]|nr:putative solute carrier family 2 facilitated glucose transporter member 9-like isoform 2 [Scophthalmus maximus]